MGNRTARGAEINGAVHTHKVGDEKGKAESRTTKGLNREECKRGESALKWGKVFHLSAPTVLFVTCEE